MLKHAPFTLATLIFLAPPATLIAVESSESDTPWRTMGYCSRAFIKEPARVAARAQEVFADYLDPVDVRPGLEDVYVVRRAQADSVAEHGESGHADSRENELGPGGNS